MTLLAPQLLQVSQHPVCIGFNRAVQPPGASDQRRDDGERAGQQRPVAFPFHIESFFWRCTNGNHTPPHLKPACQIRYPVSAYFAFGSRTKPT